MDTELLGARLAAVEDAVLKIDTRIDAIEEHANQWANQNSTYLTTAQMPELVQSVREALAVEVQLAQAEVAIAEAEARTAEAEEMTALIEATPAEEETEPEEEAVPEPEVEIVQEEEEPKEEEPKPKREEGFLGLR